MTLCFYFLFLLTETRGSRIFALHDQRTVARVARHDGSSPVGLSIAATSRVLNNTHRHLANDSQARDSAAATGSDGTAAAEVDAETNLTPSLPPTPSLESRPVDGRASLVLSDDSSSSRQQLSATQGRAAGSTSQVAAPMLPHRFPQRGQIVLSMLLPCLVISGCVALAYWRCGRLGVEYIA
eukprot:TRINITY_DN7686_c0_g2_i6.p1 TRINITY_DN7686_c0_g2~~TRINITY_DN7686_c0_g2_i6.p1  ORF type:complete len:205 (-),score=20.77 TRINITY_DN7686_c0_g2_i6:388-933(-)